MCLETLKHLIIWTEEVEDVSLIAVGIAMNLEWKLNRDDVDSLQLRVLKLVG